VVRKRLPEQVCLEEATKCGQWFCWCQSSGRSYHVCRLAIGIWKTQLRHYTMRHVTTKHNLCVIIFFPLLPLVRYDNAAIINRVNALFSSWLSAMSPKMP